VERVVNDVASFVDRQLRAMLGHVSVGADVDKIRGLISASRH
jgi:predicted DNA-binding protein (UPF0278 family)